ncbi:SigE family RNA polymerase sigma factor [Nocardioides sp. GCM10030258]|uniref:SigE family RNA polymerase sigma factor n=1 Tax=unclassified Nocardioides TaxID=2615069 RepID=UPI003606DE30
MARNASRAPTEDEFVELVHAAWPSLYRIGLLLVGEHALAEDLVQTALAKTYAHWHKVREPAAARAYARRIMVNTATSWFRRRSFGERPTEELPDRPAAGATDEHSDRIDQIDMVAALAQLAPRQRAVVVLRFYEDLSVRETAAALGVTDGTVKSQTSLALERLRTILGDEVALPADAPTTTYSTGGAHA